MRGDRKRSGGRKHKAAIRYQSLQMRVKLVPGSSGEGEAETSLTERKPTNVSTVPAIIGRRHVARMGKKFTGGLV